MPDAAPHAPAIILRLLDRLGIAVREVAQQTHFAAPQPIQAVLLEDSGGTLLVLLAKEQLLDLAHLQELSGRYLHALDAGHRQRMLDKQQLSCMPALPPLTRSPCWYEQSLLQSTEVLLESGQPGVLLQLATADFRRLLGSARGARLALPLSAMAPNLDRPDQDYAEIRSALHNAAGGSTAQRLDIAMHVPQLAPLTQTILKLRLDPDATVDDMAKVVESDPLLTGRLLCCTATPIFSATGRARSVEDVMVRVLDFNLGTHLALGLAVDQTLRPTDPGAPMEADYLRQMLRCASLMQALSRAMPRGQRPEAGLVCLCGLLHNIGYRLLAQAFTQRFLALRQLLEANLHVRHDFVEQHLLGVSREQLGSWLMRNWDMPAELATAVRFQHDPAYSGPHAVYANLLCLTKHLLAAPGSGERLPGELPEALLARLGIAQQQIATALATLPADAAVEELIAQLVAASVTRATIASESVVGARAEQF